MNDNYLDQDQLDELRYLAQESPRSMIEVYRVDFLTLIDMAEDLLNIKSMVEDGG